jgi:glucose-6-phosphate 1-epimerase
MKNMEELNKRIGISGVVKVEEGRGGLPRVVVNGARGSAEIYLFGAHVTQFQPRGAKPVLFVSKRALFDGRNPIHGGVPLVFPWFGPRKDKPLHGFVRTKPWGIESSEVLGDGSVRLVLATSSDEATKALWPHAFELRFTVVVSDFLDMTLEVRNVSKEAMEFEEALHTALAVGDVGNICIEGLAASEFLDRRDGERREKPENQPLRITGETDRLYFNSGRVTVRDPGLQRSIVVEKTNSGATEVWNPWSQKAATIADLGADQWKPMVCVEAVNARDCKVKLAGGLVHRMSQRISVEGL